MREVINEGESFSTIFTGVEHKFVCNGSGDLQVNKTSSH